MMIKNTLIFATLATTLSLSGCTGLIIGGAAVAGGTVLATAHDRRTPGTVVDDKNLQLVISNKLHKDTYVDQNSHTNITVYNGVVLVTGEAKSKDIVQKIISIAKPVPKVKRVDAAVAIGESSPLFSRANDTGITTKVKAAITSVKVPGFDTTHVKVTTERGNVYLMGLLKRNEANKVLETVRRVSGVTSVTPMFEYLD